jgi:transposase
MNTSSSQSSPKARFQRAERSQVEFQTMALDWVLAEDHQARAVWDYVSSLDLKPLYEKIRAVEGRAGRNPVDPRILMALWMFATIEGISSARQLDRLCERDMAYRWICGGVTVNYHLLSDFRTDHGEFLDQLLTDTIATLMHQNLVTLQVVAQDGMRVRASAGSSSFRRRKTLQQCHHEARQQVTTLNTERQSEEQPESSNARREAARKRASADRKKRVEKALEELEKVASQKEKRKKGTGTEARASTTDPEARNMKMGDGGFRPAYNVQFASDGDVRMVVGVDVVNEGTDSGQMSRMHEQICQRYQKTPDEYLVDGGFIQHDGVTTVERRGTRVYGPVHGEAMMRKKGHDPFARQEKDTDESFAFRQRMATDEAKQKYKKRPSIAEFPNAVCRNQGLRQFRVRGLKKARAVALWHALTFNFMRMHSLGYLG